MIIRIIRIHLSKFIIIEHLYHVQFLKGNPPELPQGIPHPEFPPKNFSLFGWPLKVSGENAQFYTFNAYNYEYLSKVRTS